MYDKSNIIALKEQLNRLLEEDNYDGKEVLIISMKLDEEIVKYMKEELKKT